MSSLDSINKSLAAAAKKLDQAASEISSLPLEPAKKHIGLIGQALANVFQIQQRIFELRPDLQPAFLNTETPTPDRDLTEKQKALVKDLSQEDLGKIDDVLLSHARLEWRKVAMIVGLTMSDLPKRIEGVPDVFYAQRVRKLVSVGCLESQGNLQYMRFSEVRLPDDKR